MTVGVLRRSAAAVVALLPGVDAHGYLSYPPMRGGASGNSVNEYCPHCGNGPTPCGDGGQWRNTDMLGYTAGPVTQYSPGEVIEVDVKITAHHFGHMQVYLIGGHINHANQDSLTRVALERVAPGADCGPNEFTEVNCQPYHPDYPERWYLPPATGRWKALFKLPEGVNCEQCTLQWVWWTANSCIPGEGYPCYFNDIFQQEGWNVASGSEKWIGSHMNGLTCHEKAGAALGCGGEEFHNCADISIVGEGASLPTPVPGTGPSPTPSTTQQSPSPSPSPTPVSGASTCLHQKDCSMSAWCQQADVYEAWCADRSSSEADCETPQCVWVVATPASTTQAATTQAATTQVSTMQASTTQAATTQEPTQMPQSTLDPELESTTPPPPSSSTVEPESGPGPACEPIFDCSEYDWCNQDGFEDYCSSSLAQGECDPTYCQMEITAAEAPSTAAPSTTSALPTFTEPDATIATTAAPTTTSSTLIEGSTSSDASCGACTGCLWYSDGQLDCFNVAVTFGLCSSKSENVWCGGSNLLAQVRRHGLRGGRQTVLMQQHVEILRTHTGSGEVQEEL